MLISVVVVCRSPAPTLAWGSGPAAELKSRGAKESFSTAGMLTSDPYRVLVRRCSRAAAAVPAAALRPLCSVLKAAAAWQQTDAIVASLVQLDIRGREEVMPSSLQALDRAAHHQVPPCQRKGPAPCGSCRRWLVTQKHDALQCSDLARSVASLHRLQPLEHPKTD